CGDARLGDEDVAVLVPRPDALCRTADGLDDRRLDLRQRKDRAQRVALDAVRLVRFLDEGAHVVPFRVESLGQRRANGRELADDRGGAPWAGVEALHLASRFRWPLMAMRIPKPAMRVTIDVPP